MYDLEKERRNIIRSIIELMGDLKYKNIRPIGEPVLDITNDLVISGFNYRLANKPDKKFFILTVMNYETYLSFGIKGIDSTSKISNLDVPSYDRSVLLNVKILEDGKFELHIRNNNKVPEILSFETINGNVFNTKLNFVTKKSIYNIVQERIDAQTILSEIMQYNTKQTKVKS